MTPLGPDLDLLDRYLVGDATAAECAVVDTWIASDPAAAELVGSMRLVGVSTAAAQTRWGQAGVWTRLAREIQEGRDASRTETLRSETGPRWRGSIFVAAALIACVVIIGIGVRHNASPTASHVTRTLATQVAQHSTWTMYDGTRITLAPQTTVTIRERDFTLVGEAFFEVAPQRAVPLVIHTGRTTTRVLGTAFDIRRYPTDPETRVVVREGKVSVGATQRVTLTAGQIAQLTDSTISTATVDDPARYTEWTTGRLVFRNAPAADVLATVGHWYGFQFQLADSVLAKALVTARFDGQSPAAILTALRSLLGVTMTFDGPRVTLRPARGSSATPVRQDLRDTLFLLPAQVGR